MKTNTNFQMIRFPIILIFLCLSVAGYAQVVTFPPVPNVQGCQYSYALQVKESGTTAWKDVPLYNVPVVNGSAKNSTVGYFDCGGPTDIQITFSTTVTSAEIGPASLNITPTFSGNTINFTIPGSQKFYVDINGNHYENCIHVIANPLEVNPPQQGDPNVLFIPAGTFVDSTVSVPNGQTLYIQGGAGVKGISLSNTTNTKVRGRGVVYRASFDAIGLRYADNVSIDGVLDFNHGWGGGGGAGIRCGESSNITITNTVSFSSKTWGDGYNIFSSENVTIDNVFIRTHDDAVTFYGGGKSGFTGDCKKINLKNSVLLNDIAQSIHVGVYGDDFDTEIRDINVSNIDICNWSQTPGRPAIYFTVGDKVRAANFHFDDIRVEDHVNTHLINMALVYNGTYNYGPGREIDSIYFTNVTYTGGHTPGISINGYNSSRLVKNVFFEGLEINGTKITSPSQGNINIGSNTENISFSLLSPPWSSSDIGAVGVAGDASLSDGTFTLEGSGADIWSTADEFRYAYQSLSGDGEIIAKVESIENTNEWAKAGVMIRETLDAGSKHALMVMTTEHGAAFQRRTSTGGSSVHSGVSGYSAPYWVRLVRSGSTLTGYRSSNGSSWTQVGSATVAMTTDVYVGLAVTSHDNSTLSTSTFSNVSVHHRPSITSPTIASGEAGTPFGYTITAGNAPTSYDATGLPAGLSVNTSSGVISGTPTDSGVSSVIISATNSYGTDADTLTLTISEPLPSPWSTSDIGAVAASGDASYSSGTFTVRGSGADIWETADEFRYVYQSLSGDGEIIAKVESIENTNEWAKAGVMIRETLDAGSKHAVMVITPQHGASFQRRTSTGGTSAHTSVSGFSAPYWVRLVRSGNTLTGYRSPDGSSWTEIGSATISMASGVYIGLVVTSHNDGIRSTGTFSNVSVSSSQTAGLAIGETYVATAQHSGKSIDVSSGSTLDGANIFQWSYLGGTNQQWVLEDAGSGYYKLKNVNSNKYMDIRMLSNADGANVQQWASTSGQNQQFQLEPAGSGFYFIKPRHSGKCIGVDSGSTADGANILQWTCDGSANQRWLFELASEASSQTSSQTSWQVAKREEISVQQDAGIEVYPNPVSNVFYIKNANVGDMVSVYSSSGKLVLQDKIGHDNKVEMGGIQPGIYFMKIKGNETSAIIKVIKN